MNNTPNFTTDSDWIQEYNKKQCPECYAINDLEEDNCKVCGWSPHR